MPFARAELPRVMVCANQAWNLVNFRAGLIGALQGAGFEVIAVAPADAPMQARLEAMGCRFVAAPIDAAGLSPWRDLKTLLALRRIVAEWRPAAWLSWTIKPNVYGSLAAAWAGVPAFPNVSGLGTAFIRRNLLTLVVKALYRWGFRRAPVVFFQNETDRAVFVEGGMVRDRQAALLPGSGIDCALWRPDNWIRPAPRHFLMLARLVADKGVREFVAAARLVKAQWSDARFTLMGFLDVANRTAIGAEEVAQWEREGIVVYAPAVDDVRPAIAAADFVVLPSYREGLSRVLLEAAALGRPIVATDVPGCREVVEEGVNGFLCAPRDATSLAAAMARAAAVDDADWLAMARAGRARTEQRFSLEQVVARYFAALREHGVRPDQGKRV